MSPDKRQRVLLGVLALLLPLVLWQYFVPLLGGVTRAGEAVQDRVGRVRGDAGPQQVVRLHELQPEVSSYTPGRNLFRFGERPKPTPPPVAPPPPVTRRTPPPVVPPPPTGPQLPQVTVSLIGTFGPDRRPIAVFRNGEELVNATLGDKVSSGFMVARIGFESVDLSYVDFPDQQAVRLEIEP